MARVRLLTPQDVPAENRAFVDGLDARGAFINIYRAMAHSPVALERFYQLLLCLWTGALNGRTREIVILSVVSASNADYPLGWHILDAAEVGLTRPEIEAIVSGDYGEILDSNEASIVKFARELALDARVSDVTYEAVAGMMDEKQLLELSLLVGLYRMVSSVANALHVDLEDEPARALEQVRGTSQ